MLPTNDGAIWTLSTAGIGLLAKLHRAIEVAGDRDAGRITLAEFDAIARDNAEARDELIARGFVAVIDPDRVIVTTWARSQGEAEAVQRKSARERKARSRATGGGACGSGGVSRATSGQTSGNAGGSSTLCNPDHVKSPGAVGSSSSPPSHSPLSFSSPFLDLSSSGEDLRSKPRASSSQGRLVLTCDDKEIAAIVAEWRELEPFDKVGDLEDLVERARRAFPALDLRAVGKEIDFWWSNNPVKRKEYRNLRRFVGSWLQRAAVQLEEKATAEAARSRDRTRKETADARAVDAIWGRR